MFVVFLEYAVKMNSGLHTRLCGTWLMFEDFRSVISICQAARQMRKLLGRTRGISRCRLVMGFLSRRRVIGFWRCIRWIRMHFWKLNELGGDGGKGSGGDKEKGMHMWLLSGLDGGLNWFVKA